MNLLSRKNRQVIVGKTDPLRNQEKSSETNNEKIALTGGEMIFEYVYQHDKKNGLLPLGSSEAGKVIYFKHGKKTANEIDKEDGHELAIKIFEFAFSDKYCQPVSISKYKIYKSKYLLQNKVENRTSPAHLGQSTVARGW